jgi:hypothetical protein
MPTDKPADNADEIPPRRAFLMIAMSDRSGVDEEVTRGTSGGAFEEAPQHNALAFRLRFIGARTAEGISNEAPAAAAGGPLLIVAALLSLRARRSSRDSPQPERTERFFDREHFGAIAIKDSSDSASLNLARCPCVWCECGA